MHDNLLKSDYNRDSHISFGISTSRDNYSEKKDLEKKEGLDSMSLVGIFLFPDAVMAFGDSRGTRKDELGNMREENATEKIMEFENRCHYSPVGLPLQFETIKF